MIIKNTGKCVLFFYVLMLSMPIQSRAEDNGLESLRQSGKAFSRIAREASPSVVFIQVESNTDNLSGFTYPSPFGDEFFFRDEFFRRFFGDSFRGFEHREKKRNRAPIYLGQGSGFIFGVEHGIFKDSTYILTSNHVVEGADIIKVKFHDGRELEAEVKGRDPKSDIAVIELTQQAGPPLILGDSSNLEVGEWVIALGNPFGLRHTLTAGVISAKGRTSIGINDYEDFIQTDAAINPGNSGGPLMNMHGEVIGINTAIFSRSGGYTGVGFAIPINMAKEIANQLIESGAVTRGYLGVAIQALTPDLAKSFGAESTQGILVSEVTKNSPAEKAGLRQGDIIISYRGHPVIDVGDFRNRVSLTPLGVLVVLKILRDGKKNELEAKLVQLKDQDFRLDTQPIDTLELGMSVQSVTPNLARKFSIKESKGLVVTNVTKGSISNLAGINVGDQVLKVNHSEINDAATFNDIVQKSKGREGVLLLLRTKNTQRYVILRW
jgi:serine protease Do